MENVKELEKEVKVKTPKASKDKEIVKRYVTKRVKEMKDYRKELGVDKDFEEADKEYIPEELEFGSQGKRFEQDQTTGKRSRMVPIGDNSQSWRSNNSEPILLTKIQSALSIIIDRNPDATFTNLIKKYEKTTDLAKALWKRNWEITNAKEVYKLFAFNLFKYGWAAGRTYPRIIKYKKEVLTELDESNPENNKYEEKELVWFNDVFRENLDPRRVWVDELSRPYDPYSGNEDYFELDYSYEAAKTEFGQYADFASVRPGDKMIYDEDTPKEDDNKDRDDIVTIGFFESRLKDLYVIMIPSTGVVLYHGPIPNDDGLLSVWDAPLFLRNTNCRYGISLWRLIKQKKALYDKMNNMTMDQLVLSIMKMGFYTGTNPLAGDGNLKITPGKIEQILNGEIKFMEVPGPGQDAWEGLRFLKSGIDDDSGINPTVEGEITGKTLGEILHAKEASLKKMKIPLENISDAMEQDAFLTLSWMSQVYSTPEIKEFADMKELQAFEDENGIQRMKDDSGMPQTFASEFDEEGNPIGSLKAPFLPQLSLHLDDREGKLIESKESRYFQVGTDIKPKDLKWRGLISIIPKSILSPSAELEKQRKIEVFNIIAPLLPTDPTGQIFGKAVKQLLKVNEEDEEDWLPDAWLQAMKQEQPLFIQEPMVDPMTGMPLDPTQAPQPGANSTMQGMAGITPNQGSPTVVPQSQVTAPSVPSVTSKVRSEFRGI